MTYCDFERIEPERVKCRRCGRTVKSVAERLTAICKSNKPLPPRKPEEFPCPHRGAFLEVMLCNKCGGEKGTPFDAFACDVHGRCSIVRKHEEVRSCVACADRLDPLEALAPAAPPANATPPV